ncbi:MAG: hypothetical protein GDA56_09205 [Hormoscilla sp. GM7CHS1pb]|nr:hypothetical protein [Hormoscilla sp. GM7CHS1pb]
MALSNKQKIYQSGLICAGILTGKLSVFLLVIFNFQIILFSYGWRHPARSETAFVMVGFNKIFLGDKNNEWRSPVL